MPSDSSAQRVWDAALGRLQLRTPKATFDTWLAGTSGMAIADGQLTVSAPSTFAAEWLTKRMQALAGEAVSAIAGQPLSVSFVVGGGQPAVSTGPASGTRAGKAEGAPRTSRLHPEFTFDAFVAGPSNQLAFAAAQSITANPNSPYNPLFIYGGLRLGKTHLLQAIGQSAEAAGRSVLYASCEQFTNDYLTAMREKRTSDFRDRYWTVDLLLIDDIQVLIGKSPTIQEGFIHTFNALLMADRQLAVTCDRPASALPLDERLTSRLAVGLQADISSPDRETPAADVDLLRSTGAGFRSPGHPRVHGLSSLRQCPNPQGLLYSTHRARRVHGESVLIRPCAPSLGPTLFSTTRQPFHGSHTFYRCPVLRSTSLSTHRTPTGQRGFLRTSDEHAPPTHPPWRQSRSDWRSSRWT